MAEPILFLDHAPALGGAEQSLLLLLKYLDRSRWQPHLACVGGPLAEKAAGLGVSVHLVPMSRLRRSARAPVDWLRGVWAITGVARKTGARLLIANTVRAALYAAPAARLIRIPFIWYMRDFWLSESRPRRLWADRLGKGLLCRAATKVIANSQATASHLPCQEKVTVIYNGIEVDRYDPEIDGQPFRERYGIPQQALVVGMVGRLRPWKGQDRFLRVLDRVRKETPEAWGMIVGGTPLGEGKAYPEQLRRLACSLGLENCLIFTGHLEDVRPALAAMDVFVHPGDPEPFGLVNIEAMAMGKPVVAFAHGALPEIVADGETGLLVPPGDEKAMAQAILTLLQDPARRYRMGAAGRDRALSCFTSAKMAQEVSAIFKRVLR
jgi:glycosyltransferase involved in cell wall biosynthesis